MDTLTITVSGIKLNDKNLNTIMQLVTDNEDLEFTEPDPMVTEEVTEEKKPAKKAKKETKEPAEEKVLEAKSPRVSLEQIIEATRELVRANKSPLVKKCLVKYNIDRVSDLSENDFESFYHDLNNI